jgi:hypothetical protein
MDTRSTQQLRARVVALSQSRPDLRPSEIAEQLGCARSTVYKVLADPSPDKRLQPATSVAAVPEATVAEVTRLGVEDPSLSAAAIHAILTRRKADGDRPVPVPSVRTVARLLAKLRSPADQIYADFDSPDSSPATPPDPLLPGYEADAGSRRHFMLLEPEASLLRALVREAVAELDRPDADPRGRPRRREHVADLVLTYMRASRLAAEALAHVPTDVKRAIRLEREAADERAIRLAREAEDQRLLQSAADKIDRVFASMPR